MEIPNSNNGMLIPDPVREAEKRMGGKELDEYIQKVNRLLEGMKPGDVLIIEKITKSETREQFIAAVKKYMDKHEWQDGLSFSSAFTELKKYDLDFIKNGNKKNVTL
jgi:hypothetical protein